MADIAVGAAAVVAVDGVVVVGVVTVGAAKSSGPPAVAGLSMLSACPKRIVPSPYFLS